MSPPSGRSRSGLLRQQRATDALGVRVALDRRSRWVVSRIDPASGRKLGSVGVGNDPSAIAAGAGSVWVTNSSDGTVTRIDPASLLPTTIPVGHRPAAVAVNPAGAWIANAGDNRSFASTPERTPSPIRRPSVTGRRLSSLRPPRYGWRTATTARSCASIRSREWCRRRSIWAERRTRSRLPMARCGSRSHLPPRVQQKPGAWRTSRRSPT